MSKKNRKTSVNKGAPSGLLVSLIFHAAVFFVAGLFVVFTVVNKAEPEFVQPAPIERPKMQLKKPKVKVQKSSQPKPSSRIVAKVKSRDMPEIQLPDMMGSGEGLLSGGTGDGGVFMDLPDINTVRLMGSKVSTGSDFIGTYYDFNRRSTGAGQSIDQNDFEEAILRFILSDWNTTLFSRYYKSPNKRYATCFMVPSIPSDLGPESFGEPGAAGYCWAVHYKGKLVHKDGIKFRFWGFGDDILMVRLDGKLVLAGSWPDSVVQVGCGWHSPAPESGVYRLGIRGAQISDWITLEPGVPLDMEVLIGEIPGGSFCAQLLVEVDGVDYETNDQGGPILPMFTTETPSWGVIDAIAEHLVYGEAKLTNGPVFNDYGASTTATDVAKQANVEKDASVDKKQEPELRTWTTTSGKTIQAKYDKVVMDRVWLVDAARKEIKIPLDSLVESDRFYVELYNPPQLDIEFHNKQDQLTGYYKGTIFLHEEIPPSVSEYSFKASVKAQGSKPYHHGLHVSYYAIGRQRLDRDKYVLLEKRKGTFVPSESEEIILSGAKIRLRDYIQRDINRGHEFAHYLVLVRDERGEIIAHRESASWLFENLNKLEKLPAGAYMNTDCRRVHPTGPKNPTFYEWETLD
ncbi:MAG: hypothetical protein JXR25_14850 [Pontiellaceae bacterium]|nr:hypothetical protein [Pontiellaceae bacterium]MBN2786098.1 hypothetical protein [Pontiellaceae bacterium]